MALPYIFASLTTISTPQFDANFNALGALTPVPCSVTGKNNLVLTPLTNTPTVAVLQNYMQFTGIAVNSNSTAVTANVNSLGALNVYIDTSVGPVAVTANQIIAGTFFTLMYDSSLNSGSGGFHLLSAVVIGSFLPLGGGTLTGALVGTSGVFSGALQSATATVTGALSAATISGVATFSAASLLATNLSATTATISTNANIGGTLAVTSGATVGSLKLDSGSTLKRLLTGSVVFGGSTIAAQSQAASVATITGVSVGDIVQLSWPYDFSTVGLSLGAGVVATGTIAAKVFNYSAASIAFSGGTCNVIVLGYV